MLRIFFALFLALHGLVHLLYLGQSRRIFELQPGLVWPDGSWAFSRLFGDEATRLLAGVLLVLAALGFVAGGIGLFLQQGWWRPVTVTVAVFSTVVYLLLWDGGWQRLDDKGGVGLLINVALIVALLVLQWPDVGS